MIKNYFDVFENLRNEKAGKHFEIVTLNYP